MSVCVLLWLSDFFNCRDTKASVTYLCLFDFVACLCVFSVCVLFLFVYVRLSVFLSVYCLSGSVIDYACFFLSLSFFFTCLSAFRKGNLKLKSLKLNLELGVLLALLPLAKPLLERKV